jgi:hypothetical protein
MVKRRKTDADAPAADDDAPGPSGQQQLADPLTAVVYIG